MKTIRRITRTTAIGVTTKGLKTSAETLGRLGWSFVYIITEGITVEPKERIEMGDKFENISGGIIATRGSTIALEGAIVAAHEAIIEHASTLNQRGQQDAAEALK